MKTYTTKLTDIKRSWHVIDADGQTLGRLASNVAQILKGKHNPFYAPNMDTGDHVVVINAEKIHVTGKKMTDKTYYRHSGYPGGLRETNLDAMMAKYPARVIEIAIKGMLPHNVLGRQMFRKLRVYVGPEHPHEAQINAGQAKPQTAAKNARRRRHEKEALAASESVAQAAAVAAEVEAATADEETPEADTEAQVEAEATLEPAVEASEETPEVDADTSDDSTLETADEGDGEQTDPDEETKDETSA